MRSPIAARTPKGSGSEPGVGLAHRRLSIIDLEGGDQPIGNEDGSIQVVFNGEIYNFQELRRDLEARGHRFRTRSDTEVLVHLYEEHGQCAGRTAEGHVRLRPLGPAPEGDWCWPATAWASSRSTSTAIAEKLVFGSELKAILACPGVPAPSTPPRWKTISPTAWSRAPGRSSGGSRSCRRPMCWLSARNDFGVQAHATGGCGSSRTSARASRNGRKRSAPSSPRRRGCT